MRSKVHSGDEYYWAWMTVEGDERALVLWLHSGRYRAKLCSESNVFGPSCEHYHRVYDQAFKCAQRLLAASVGDRRIVEDPSTASCPRPSP